MSSVPIKEGLVIRFVLGPGEPKVVIRHRLLCDQLKYLGIKTLRTKNHAAGSLGEVLNGLSAIIRENVLR